MTSLVERNSRPIPRLRLLTLTLTVTANGAMLILVAMCVAVDWEIHWARDMISLSKFGTDGGLLQRVLQLYSLPGTCLAHGFFVRVHFWMR